ncbi:unnamed protein product [Caenorhabditis bovis]|uniref:Uncharacterized protein n=1 Tax=Caenorhabditis bovis TaxID=2654633 RepID=A0A8S1EUI3_9PELO|nr:unnamed protein product [Caenorhabditis bovis]
MLDDLILISSNLMSKVKILKELMSTSWFIIALILLCFIFATKARRIDKFELYKFYKDRHMHNSRIIHETKEEELLMKKRQN